MPKSRFAALEAGKSVYNEKPVAIKREDARKMLDMAKAKGLRVGGAPDTFMGAGIQTCIKLLDDGWIGNPIGATACMACHGPESWHPDPEFYYKIGGGPMLDMGPYYLTALVALMGPVRRVTGSTRISFPERTITSTPKFGTKIRVDVPTHVTGIMDFANGAIGTIITSFDVWAANLPCIEIYGTEGSMSVPDPNCFGGPVKIRREGAVEWSEVPLSHIYAENSRGLGIADMAVLDTRGQAEQSRQRSGVSCARHYALVPRCVGEGRARGTGEHLPASASAADRPAAWLFGCVICRLTAVVDPDLCGSMPRPTSGSFPHVTASGAESRTAKRRASTQ